MYFNLIKFIFIFSFIVIADTGNNKFTDSKIVNSGIYYEYISKIKLTTDTFKLITVVNTSNYENKYNDLIDINDKTIIFCTVKSIENVTEICQQFSGLINNTISQLKKRFNTYNALKTHKINKRGLINVVGTFGKWAFGTLNEDDLIEIDTKIKTQGKKNKATLDIIKLQTRIVQSTLNNYNNVTNTINDNTIKLKTTLDQLINAVNNNTQKLQIIDISQTLTQHLIFFNIILTEFNQETEELIESVIWGQNGQLHPSIINPKTMINQLIEIEKIIPKQLSIPQNPEEIINFMDFLKLLTISLHFMDTYLIYTIYIPLCEIDNYMIYHITPFPVPIKNNNYIFIKPSNEYLAISQDNEKFVTFTHQDYNLCKHSIDITICYPHDTIIRNTHDTCEVQLFIDPQYLPDSCDIRHIKTSETFYKKLISKNSWIYASINSQTVTLICPETSKTIKITGSGILSIKEPCYITTPTTILKPNNCNINITTNIDFTPQFHITNVSINLSNKINKVQESMVKIPALEKIDNQLNDIAKSSKSLDFLVDMIDTEEENLKKMTNLTNHSYLLYAILIIVGYFITYFIIKCIRNKCVKYCLKTTSTQKLQRRHQNYADAPV